MPTILVLGAGPGVGAAVAHRFAREGFDVVLVARRRDPLEALAEELRATGATAHVLPFDLAETVRVPELARQVRDLAGAPDTLYYGACGDTFVPVLDLDVETVHELLRLSVDTPIALVRELLPAMLERGAGTVLGTQGASAVHGNPDIAGGLVLAAQRNYLQALHAAVADRGVYVGGLYVGAAIEGTPFHAWLLVEQAEGRMTDFPVVHPDVLADRLWTMRAERLHADAVYPVTAA